jgi:hypothetical protein
VALKGVKPTILKRLRELTDDRIVSTTAGDWQGYCHRMRGIEENCCKRVIFYDVINGIVTSIPYEEVLHPETKRMR